MCENNQNLTRKFKPNGQNFELDVRPIQIICLRLPKEKLGNCPSQFSFSSIFSFRLFSHLLNALSWMFDHTKSLIIIYWHNITTVSWYVCMLHSIQQYYKVLRTIVTNLFFILILFSKI